MTDEMTTTAPEGRSFERSVQRTYCSFCGASDTEVLAMVSNGHGAQICNWCADIAAQVISTQRAAAGEAEYTAWIESLNHQIVGGTSDASHS